MTAPTPPIELRGSVARWPGAVDVPPEVIGALRGVCTVVDDEAAVADCSRDWWPLALHWALRGEVPARAAAVARPATAEQVAAVVRVCADAQIPLTVAGGRSGVCGASVPVHGGVLADLTDLAGIGDVDVVSGIVEVLAGTFGPDLETELQQHHGLSVGHFPQSFDLATVGGWVACRGAGQYSTRYGKIEDLVAGLEVVLADGSAVRTGGAPAAAVGPDLTQLFLGSEGTLGVITRVWLRAHPLPETEERAAYAFPSFVEGVEACRTVLRRGATPAVLRLYDEIETARSHHGDGAQSVLLVLDEGDATIVEATMAVVADACRGGSPASTDLVGGWLEHRNDTSALRDLTHRGFVVDTMEIAAPWARLAELFEAVRAALLTVPHALVASCHLSHSYPDGACLYFTFAAAPPEDEVEATYVALWDAGQRAVLDHGGNLSHHHGVGINRARFVGEALGPSRRVLAAVKSALDPLGILNPGKLGLDSPFGPTPWPPTGAVSRRRPPEGGSEDPVRKGHLAGRIEFDWDAIRAGGLVALVFAVPFSIAGRWAADSRNDSTLAVWLNIGAVVGFVIGAGCAAWTQRTGTPLSHGLVTAVGTYLAAQAVFVVFRLIRGLDVRWFAVLFNLTVVLAAGLVGGLLGQHFRDRGIEPRSR